MVNLIELSKHYPDMTINIKIGDLIEANKKLIENDEFDKITELAKQFTEKLSQ